MRFLLTPNFASPYDRRMVDRLACALAAIGHESEAVANPLSEAEAVALCRKRGVDVLLQVNRFRPADPPLPPTIRHIAWMQDIFPTTLDSVNGRTRDTDMIYTLGDAAALGLTTSLPCRVGCLVTGVDERIFAGPGIRNQNQIDFSLCGYIPRMPRALFLDSHVLIWIGNKLIEYFPLVLAQRWPLPGSQKTALLNTVQTMYSPLRGELDIHLLAGRLREISESYITKGRTARARAARPDHLMRYEARRRLVMDRHINNLSRDYPRLLDRVALVQRALGVSKSLELYGPGWNRHAEFRPYHKGIIETQEGLSAVYRRTRLNLSNNTHGLGLHSRTLECMAVGGFIFTHCSPNDQKPGGMLTEFEPGVHFGQYTPETLEEEARRWLRDENRRAVAGARAAVRVRERHLWRHRARQIVDDLAQ